MSIEADFGTFSMARIVRALSGAVAFVGLGLGGLGMTVYEPMESYPWKILVGGAAIGGVLILLLVAVVFAVKRFISPSFPMRALVSPLPFALLIVGIGLMATINGVLDFQGPQEFETVIVHKQQRGGTSSAAWFKVRDFRPGRDNELLTISPEGLFDQLNEGDQIIVVAGHGLVEWWLDGIRATSTPQAEPSPPQTRGASRE